MIRWEHLFEVSSIMILELFQSIFEFFFLCQWYFLTVVSHFNGCRTDILILFLSQDANLLRSYVTRAEGTPLLGLLVYCWGCFFFFLGSKFFHFKNRIRGSRKGKEKKEILFYTYWLIKQIFAWLLRKLIFFVLFVAYVTVCVHLRFTRMHFSFQCIAVL